LASQIKRDKFLRRLTDLQFLRNDINLTRGTYRVRGDVIEFIPASADKIVRINFNGDEIEKISEHDPLTGQDFGGRTTELTIFPAKHFVTPQRKIAAAINNIRTELHDQVKFSNPRAKKSKPSASNSEQTSILK
jgi:excinuclease ABC subunit B